MEKNKELEIHLRDAADDFPKGGGAQGEGRADESPDTQASEAARAPAGSAAVRAAEDPEGLACVKLARQIEFFGERERIVDSGSPGFNRELLRDVADGS